MAHAIKSHKVPENLLDGRDTQQNCPFLFVFSIANNRKSLGHQRPNPRLSCHVSSPNMTGRRFHRATEVIPRRPWKSKSPFASKPIKTSKNNTRTQGWGARGTTRYFLHSFPSCSPPVYMGKPGTIGQFFRALFPSTWRTLSPDALFTRIWDTRKHPESATFSCFPC